MSNRLAHFYRAQWPNRRLSEAELAALGAAPRPAPGLTRLLTPDAHGMASAQDLEIALLTQNSPWDVPLNPALELAGRGYKRAPCGPMLGIPGPWRWQNQLLILFPQAKADWGLTYYIALLEIGVDNVVATAPIPIQPVAIIAEDQLRIPPRGITLGGVLPNTPRPYGAGRYGESLYGVWPAAGEIFYCRVDGVGYQWATQPNSCGSWATMPPIYSGGCAA